MAFPHTTTILHSVSSAFRDYIKLIDLCRRALPELEKDPTELSLRVII